ncbi:hypothetical protein QVD17_10487 [Tagetes erecta]|uniref:Uncharacterized protein n=1 Tax=Tagetes erecta TaxID=13708 RepID=A0AAD8NZK0_TARER|nr:hypothetical protein QVD17_10487 [Tagetes erecta]
MVLPPPPLSLLCLISIVTLYLMICYAVIGFIAKSELFRVDSHAVEHDHQPSGLSREELQLLRCFNHRVGEGHEESLSCAICLDDFEDFEKMSWEYCILLLEKICTKCPSTKRAYNIADLNEPICVEEASFAASVINKNSDYGA